MHMEKLGKRMEKLGKGKGKLGKRPPQNLAKTLAKQRKTQGSVAPQGKMGMHTEKLGKRVENWVNGWENWVNDHRKTLQKRWENKCKRKDPLLPKGN